MMLAIVILIIATILYPGLWPFWVGILVIALIANGILSVMFGE